MKKLFFLFALMGLFAFTASAQDKPHCTKKASSAKVCTKKASSKACAGTAAAMEKAAAADKNIVRQVADNGEVKYVRKSVCPMSGKVSYEPVEYCSKAGKFINVSPGEKGASCTKKAGATKVSSSTSEKACCAKGKKAGKACCAKGAKSAKASCTKKGASEKASMKENGTDAKVKLVNETEGQ